MFYFRSREKQWFDGLKNDDLYVDSGYIWCNILMFNYYQLVCLMNTMIMLMKSNTMCRNVEARTEDEKIALDGKKLWLKGHSVFVR